MKGIGGVGDVSGWTQRRNEAPGRIVAGTQQVRKKRAQRLTTTRRQRQRLRYWRHVFPSVGVDSVPLLWVSARGVTYGVVMLRKLFGVVGVFSLLIAAPLSAASAADMPVKAPPLAPAPAAPIWTGFYIGGEIGGAWANRSVNYTANDPVANALVAGTLTGTGQPLFPNTFNMSGMVGGAEAGYNWQVGRQWLLGIETDYNGSSLRGTGNSSSVFTTAPPTNNALTEKQSVDWYGTLRGRLGWLPSDNVLLFATSGFAYGRVVKSGSYSVTAAASGLPFFASSGGVSFACVTNATCFSGTSSSVQTGWTAGGGVEWFAWRNWSLKAEYQYVNLGSDAVRLTATGLRIPGTAPASFNTNFARDDFHVVRAGVNYHF
jgi:outer membrane immunogenic protein